MCVCEDRTSVRTSNRIIFVRVFFFQPFAGNHVKTVNDYTRFFLSREWPLRDWMDARVRVLLHPWEDFALKTFS